jgi:hypothetical protein
MSKVIVKKLDEKGLTDLGVKSWPVWTKEVSRFEWTYSGTEECYIIEGEFVVETDDGKYEIRAGDFVTFKDGLSCIWDIKKPVKKYYNFS